MGPASNSRTRKAVVVIAFGVLLILIAVLLVTHAGFMRDVSPASNGVVVHGPDLELVQDGKNTPFLMKGVILTAFVAPDSLLGKSAGAAHDHFGSAILEAAKTWGVNTIRFNFSQPAMDPQDPLYSQSYLDEIQSAVSLARSMGFIVIATDQDEGPSGEPDTNAFNMPTAASERADMTLANLFKGDQSVILDIFNEAGLPMSTGNRRNWDVWLDGGTVNGQDIVGMQTILTALRDSGAKNVIFLSALSGSLTGVPTVNDPLNNYMYDKHQLDPTFDSGVANPQVTADEWQAEFGYLTDAGRPVVIGAFDASLRTTKWCQSDPSFHLPQTFLDYLAQKHIGVVGWSFDVPGTIVTDFNGTPTSYANGTCGGDGGPGEILKAQFAKT